MHKGLTGRLALVALLPLAVFAAENPLPKADRDPTPPTLEQKILVRDGVALHDQGDFDGAIAKYRQVLNANQDEVFALHELGFTYFTKKDYQNALDTARRGARYRSPLLASFHMLMGNVLDEMGDRDQAIAVYRAAIEQSPDIALLHFNLALSLTRSNNLTEAKSALEDSVTLNPQHASSHCLLGNVYAETGYRVPAVLALSRCLMLEPASERARKALDHLETLIHGGVSKGDKPNAINITFAAEAKKDEGDFGPVDLVMSMSLAAGEMESKKKATPFSRFADIYSVMADVMSRMDPAGFAARYYAPFFTELEKRGFIEAFVSTSFASANLEGAEAWAKKNEGKLCEYRDWVKSYRWPAGK
jgi:tetratricopeptide (TPR) repeat protein